VRLPRAKRFGTPLVAALIGVAALGSGGAYAVSQLSTSAKSGPPAADAPSSTTSAPPGASSSAVGSATAGAATDRSTPGTTSSGRPAVSAAQPSVTTSATSPVRVTPTGAAPPAVADTPAPPPPPSAKPTTAAPTPPSQPVPTTAPPPSAPRPGGVPGPGNTGVPAGTTLTVVNGDLTISTAGQVVDGLDIKGALTINASNVVVRRSLIEGRSGRTSVIVASGTGIVFSDDEVTVASPSPASDSMSVKNATITRLNIHGGVDGIKLGANSTVTGSWIHGLSAFASDPAQGGRATHNDAIQILSGTNIHITGNNLQVTSHNNSAIQVTQDQGTVSGLVVSSNWADGGGCTFNFSGHGPGGVLLTMSGITLVNNRFGHGSQFDCPVLIDRQTTIVQSGNVYDGTGKPIAIQSHN
jgi:hypothetical protein